jgi:hypothetical protein
LVDAQRYRVTIQFKFLSYVIEFDNASSAFSFYKHFNLNAESFYETQNCLYEDITKNVEFIFGKVAYQHAKHTLVEILKQKQDGLSDKNFLLDLKLVNMVELIKELLIGYFAFRRKSEIELRTIIDYLNQIFVESLKVKLDSDSKTEALKISLCAVFEYKKMLKEFNLHDRRFETAFSFLINLYKKCYFNDLAIRLCVILDNMADPSYYKTPKGPVTYTPFIEFIDEVKKFISEFIPFKETQNFSEFLIDFQRKIYYFFFNYLKGIIEGDMLKIGFAEYLALLDGMFYLNRESDKIISEIRMKFQSSNQAIKMLVNFKNQYFFIGDHIVKALKAILDQQITAKLQSLDLLDFDLEHLFNNQLMEIYQNLETTHSFYSLRVLKIVMTKIIEIVLIRIHESPQLTKQQIEDVIEKIRNFFIDNLQDQNFDNFLKFLDYDLIFLNSKNRQKCEMSLGMMKTILGDEISDKCIYSIINTKDYKGASFTAQTMNRFYIDLIAKQQSGDEKLNQKLKYNRQINNYLYIWKAATNMVVFFHRVRREGFGFEESDLRMKESFETINKKFEIGTLQKFSETMKIMIVGNQSLANIAEDQRIGHIKSLVHSGNFKECKMVYRNHCFNAFDQNNRLIEIWPISKFEKFEKHTHNNTRFILLNYHRSEKIIAIPKNAEIFDRICTSLQELINAFKNLTYNPKKYSNEHHNLRHCEGGQPHPIFQVAVPQTAIRTEKASDVFSAGYFSIPILQSPRLRQSLRRQDHSPQKENYPASDRR